MVIEEQIHRGPARSPDGRGAGRRAAESPESGEKDRQNNARRRDPLAHRFHDAGRIIMESARFKVGRPDRAARRGPRPQIETASAAMLF